MELLRLSGEAVLAAWLEEGAHLIRYEVGRIDLRLEPSVSQDVVSRLQEAASRLTGRRWLIAIGQAPGEPTLAEQHRRQRGERLLELGRDAGIQRLLETFPGATLVELRAPPRPSPEAGKEETTP
jgi:DNA polymerase-3 subunit gamma/tau